MRLDSRSLPAMLAIAALFIAPIGAHASSVSVPVFETFGPFTVDDLGGAINSGGSVGSLDNSFVTTASTGGYMADTIVVSGTLDNSMGFGGTFGSEADLSISTFGAGTFSAGGGTGATYSPPLVIPGTTTSVAPFDPGAGPLVIEFFESFDDGAGPDQTWLDVTVDFAGAPIITDGVFGVGTLPDDGTMVFGPGQSPNAYHSNVAGGLDYFDFVIPAGPQPASSFLNIQTLDALSGDTIDTEIALFDAGGVLVAYDDDDQVTANGGLYSLLSFGADPDAGDATPGEDGAVPAPGMYTAVVGGFDTNFEDLTIGTSTLGDVVAGTSSGDYDVKFTYFVPEPTTLSLLTLAATLGLAFRRRK